MKKLLFVIALITSFSTFGQDVTDIKYTSTNKGKFFVYWGGNRETYSKSDITFTGEDYNFTLENVPAHDKPKGWHIDYFNPTRMTIPQTNFKLGYFISDHYNISIGVDHMKYVMHQNVPVTISGSYPNAGNYGETLPNSQVLLTEEFLTFEHTDGLNYINTDIARFDDITKFLHLPNTDKFQVNTVVGAGFGLLYPKTNAKVFDKPRHDDFHVSGWGTGVKAGLNFTFFKHFFIQTELKGGYINMQDIRTTGNTNDKASQDFLFLQKIIVIGGIFRI